MTSIRRLGSILHMRYLIMITGILICLTATLKLYESSIEVPTANTTPIETELIHAPRIDESPYQKSIKSPPFRYGNATLEPVSEFIVTARVLSKKNYSDDDAEYIPMDLALGWGKMSDQNILKSFTIRQSNRWFYWKTQKFPIPRKEVVRSASNMHMIPASPEVKKQLDQIAPQNIVQISGKLVNFINDRGIKLKTSTSRNDSGAGACEVVFVESALILE